MSKSKFLKYNLNVLLLIILLNMIFYVVVPDQMILVLSFKLNGMMRVVSKTIALSLTPSIILFVIIIGYFIKDQKKTLHMFILNIILFTYNIIVVLVNLF